MGPQHPAATPLRRRQRGLGLPVWVIVGLSLLSVPRVFAHDLGLDPGPVYGLLTIGPLVVWVAVVLRARVPSPVLTLLAVGLVYGVVLGIVHNLLWDEVFRGEDPVLGDLDADLSEAPLRIAAFVSSVFTGAVVGLLTGLVAAGLDRVRRARR